MAEQEVARREQNGREKLIKSAHFPVINELIPAQDDHRLSRFLASAQKQQLTIIYEFGFIPFSSAGSHPMFQFFSNLYERVAVMVTSNLNFTDWTQVFGDKRLTAALLYRLTHRSPILEFIGDSYLRETVRVDQFSASKWTFRLTKISCPTSLIVLHHRLMRNPSRD